MERLTYKNYIEEYEVNFEKNSKKQWSIAESDTHIKVTGEPIDKLAEFEDFMEEQGVESLEDFKKALEIKLPDERVKQIALEEMRKEMKNHIAQILKKEVPELYKFKDRWQKLKEWLISTLEEKQNSPKYYKFNNVLNKMQELEKE